MKPTLDFLSLIHLFGAAQGIFLSVIFFFHKRGNRRANRLLGLLLLTFSLRLLEVVAYWSKYLLVHPHLTGVSWSLPFLFGTLLYLYARELSLVKPSFTWKTSVHFLPYLLSQGWMIPFYFLSATIKKAIIMASMNGAVSNDEFSIKGFLHTLILFLHLLIYVILTVNLLKKSASATNSRTAIEKAKLTWLRQLTIAFTCFFGLWLFYNLAVTLGIPYQRWIDYGVTFSMAFFIYAIGYTTIRKPEILSGDLAIRNGLKYERSALTPGQAEHYLEKLLQMMETERPYLNNELKMPDLAQTIGLSTNHLSQVINDKLELNFFDFINRYRVAEAKRLLAQPEQRRHTLLHIAHESGFNNKTSFNAAFKKFTGQTPSEFLKNINDR